MFTKESFFFPLFFHQNECTKKISWGGGALWIFLQTEKIQR